MSLLSYLNQFNIETTNESLYLSAFTHSSYKLTDPHAQDYEKLEFLGDSVYNFVISSIIFRLHPNISQGNMTNVRKNFVRTEAVASLGRKLKLQEYIRTGKSISAAQLLANDKYFEDIFEALIGAIYLDQGIDFVTSFITKLVEKSIKEYDFEQVFDYISALQEYTQSERSGLPVYETVSGNGKEGMFHATVMFDGITLGKGNGASKNKAEQAAAKDAISKLAVPDKRRGS